LNEHLKYFRMVPILFINEKLTQNGHDGGGGGVIGKVIKGMDIWVYVSSSLNNLLCKPF
jgi:hypothetical protein